MSERRSTKSTDNTAPSDTAAMSAPASPSKADQCAGVSRSSSSDEGLPRDLSELSELSISGEQFRCDDHADGSLNHMYTYLQMGKLTDVVLIAGGYRIPAHKLVLSAASEYFSVMFTGSLKESTQDEITLESVDGEALQSLINFCYTGSINLHEEIVEVLLSTASLLQLTKVVDACCNFLQKQLHPSNCLGIAIFAEQQSCIELRKQATDYICENFMEVSKNQEFLSLTSEQLFILLKSDDLNVPSEKNVFESVAAWANHDWLNREKYSKQMLELIKLPLLSPDYIFDQVDPLFGHIKECHLLIMEALKWHLLPDRHCQLTTHRTTPRKSTLGKLLAVGGMDTNKGASTIEVYDPRSNTWSELMKLESRRVHYGVAIICDKLFLVGGRDGLKTLNTVESLDLNTMTLSLLPAIGTPRHGLAVAAMDIGFNSTIYAIGGHDGWSYLNTVERWDPISRTWTYVAPMHSNRFTCGTAVLGGKVYVVGGRDGSYCLNSVEMYCPNINTWLPCKSMARNRGGVSVAVSGKYIYALGGHESVTTASNNSSAPRFACVERYDSETNLWSPIASLSVGRDAIGTCLLGNKLVAVGGYDGVNYLQIVEEYDAQKDEWRPLGPLKLGRAGACVIHVKIGSAFYL